VHPDAAADRSRDRARELEAAELGVARTVEDDRVRRAAAGADAVALDGDRGELAHELQHEELDAPVRDEEIRPEADDCDAGVAITPGSGCSRAGYTSATATASAAESARPNSGARCSVRE